MTPLNIGIIGCGAIAREHLTAIASIDEINPILFYDVDYERAAAFAAAHPSARATRNVDDLLADDRLDAVYICTHHDSHAPLALKAAAAGRHIMMEKPLALTLQDCDRIVEGLDASGVTFMTAFKLRYYPMVSRAREFVRSPLVSSAQIMDARWDDKYWAQDPIKGGGNLLSQGCHAMDLLCYLNDSDPVRIHAEGGTFTHADTPVMDTPVMDTMVATIRFANGRVASLTQSDAGLTPFVSKFSFHLADGVRTVHLHERLTAGEFFDGEQLESLHDSAELGMLGENREFVAALREGRPPKSGIRDGYRATLMVLKALESIRTGVPQSLDISSIFPE